MVKIKWFWSLGDLLRNGGIAVVPEGHGVTS